MLQSSKTFTRKQRQSSRFKAKKCVYIPEPIMNGLSMSIAYLLTKNELNLSFNAAHVFLFHILLRCIHCTGIGRKLECQL